MHRLAVYHAPPGDTSETSKERCWCVLLWLGYHAILSSGTYGDRNWANGIL